MQSIVIDHPIAQVRLSTIRDCETTSAGFRTALRELARILVYEAARELPTEPVTVRTPVAEAAGTAIAGSPVVVPVLRAGLGMADAALELLPGAELGLVGMARDEQTLQPTTYLESLPGSLAGRPVLVLDPMLATGGSLLATLELLRDRGADDLTCVCVLAAPEGVEAVERSGLAGRLVMAAIDERLNEHGFIVPGLGDAGDRQFGTAH